MYVTYLIKSEYITHNESLVKLFTYLQQFNITEDKYVFDVDTINLENEYTTNESLYNLSRNLLIDIVDVNKMGLMDISQIVDMVRAYSENMPQLDRESLSNGLHSLEPKDIPLYLDMTKETVIKHNEQVDVKNKTNNKYGLGLLALFACLHNSQLVRF